MYIYSKQKYKHINITSSKILKMVDSCSINLCQLMYIYSKQKYKHINITSSKILKMVDSCKVKLII